MFKVSRQRRTQSFETCETSETLCLGRDILSGLLRKLDLSRLVLARAALERNAGNRGIHDKAADGVQKHFRNPHDRRNIFWIDSQVTQQIKRKFDRAGQFASQRQCCLSRCVTAALVHGRLHRLANARTPGSREQ